MITEKDILLLHEFSIRDFGGTAEVRDAGLMLSAIARPFQTFDGGDLYTTVIEKAAALGESLIINHPFADGNKRTAFLAMVALLHEYGLAFDGEPGDTYNKVIAMSTGQLRFEEIVEWLKWSTTIHH